MKKKEEPAESIGAVVRLSDVEQELARQVAKMPWLISYDPTKPENELKHLRMMTDEGIPAQLRDGWRAIVVEWAVGTAERTDEDTGEASTLPTLALVSHDGRMCRLFGWPAVTSFAAILRYAGQERAQRGIPVVARRRQSGTVGRSYWTVSVDDSKGASQ